MCVAKCRPGKGCRDPEDDGYPQKGGGIAKLVEIVPLNDWAQAQVLDPHGAGGLGDLGGNADPGRVGIPREHGFVVVPVMGAVKIGQGVRKMVHRLPVQAVGNQHDPRRHPWLLALGDMVSFDVARKPEQGVPRRAGNNLGSLNQNGGIIGMHADAAHSRIKSGYAVGGRFPFCQVVVKVCIPE